MVKYKVKEVHVDATDDNNRILIWEGVKDYEAPNRRGLMFQLQKEYGKVTTTLSKIATDDKVVKVGWVLSKKIPTGVSDDTSTQEVWAEVLG